VAAMRGLSALGAAIIDDRNAVSTISDGVVHLTALEFGTRLHVLPVPLTTADLKRCSVGVGVGIAAVLIGRRALFGVGSNERMTVAAAVDGVLSKAIRRLGTLFNLLPVSAVTALLKDSGIGAAVTSVKINNGALSVVAN
jgi:hypothetical protein